MNLHTRTQNWWIKTAAIVSAVNLLVSPIAQAALTWDANAAGAGQTDGLGVWLTANQWWNGSTNQTWVSSSDAIFGNGGAGGAVTLGAGGTTANSLTLNSFTGTYTLGTAGSVLTITTGITMNSGSGIVTISSPVTLGGSQSWTNSDDSLLTVGTGAITLGANALTLSANSTGGITLSSVISSTTAGNGIIINSSGSGVVKLTGINTFNGGVTLKAGTLQLGTSSAALGTGTFQIGNSTGTTAVTFDSVSALTPTNAIDIYQDFTYTGTSALGQSSGAITLKTNGTTGTHKITVSASTLTLSGAIGDGGNAYGITKDGNGTLIIQTAGLNNNSFSGVVKISGGILIAGYNGGPANAIADGGTNSSLGSGSSAIILDGGTLDIRGNASFTSNRLLEITANGGTLYVPVSTLTFSSTAALTVSGSTDRTFSILPNITSPGSGIIVFNPQIIDPSSPGKLKLSLAASTGGQWRLLNTSNSYTGGTDLVSGNISFATGALGSTGAITFTGNSTLTWAAGNTQDISSRIVANSGVTGTLSPSATTVFASALNTGGSISGNFATAGSSTLQLNAAPATLNTFSIGGTSILQINAASALANVTALTFAGGSLQYTVNDTTNYGSKIKNSGSAIKVDTNSQTVNLSGVDSSNTAGFTKSGAGTLNLTGSNAYTGATTVSAGTLNIAAASALPSASTLTLSGGTLDNTTGSTLNITNPFTLTTTTIFTGTNAIVQSTGNVSLTGLLTMAAGSKNLTLGGNVATLSFSVSGADATAGKVIVNGNLPATGGITAATNGYLVLGGNNSSWAGTLGASGGGSTIEVANANGLGGATFFQPLASATLKNTSGSDISSVMNISPGNNNTYLTYDSPNNFTTTGRLTMGGIQGLIIANANGYFSVAKATYTGMIAGPGKVVINDTMVSGAGNVLIKSSGTLELLSIGNGQLGTQTTSVVAPSGSTTLTFGSVAGMAVGQRLGFQGIANGQYITDITGLVVTLSAPTTFGIASGSVIPFATGGGLPVSTNAAASIVLDTGTLRYSGSGETTDRLFTIGATTAGATGAIDSSGATNPLIFGNTGAILYGTTAQTRTLILTGSNTGANTFAPLIGNNGTGLVSLTKSGAGTWILPNANTYTGGTAINAGTLRVNNTSGSGTGTGAVNVNNNGTLAGTGIIGGAVTVNSGGTIKTGDGTAALKVNSLTLNSGAILDASAITSTEKNIVIIDNQGGSAVSGTFDGKPEGATFSAHGASYKISYVGGTGNDVTLKWVGGATVIIIR